MYHPIITLTSFVQAPHIHNMQSTDTSQTVTGKICTEPFSYLPVSYPQCTAAPANFAAYVHVHSLNSMYINIYICGNDSSPERNNRKRRWCLVNSQSTIKLKTLHWNPWGKITKRQLPLKIFLKPSSWIYIHVNEQLTKNHPSLKTTHARFLWRS